MLAHLFGRTSLALPAIAALVSCSPAIGEQPDTPVAVAIDVESDGASANELWKRLANDELEGLAMVWPDAVLYPTAKAAREGAPKRKADGSRARAVQILADEGDVVKVRTWLSGRVRDGMTALTDYDLTLYATRDQLIPVLREPVESSFADGSAYVLQEGLLLSVTTAIKPLSSALSGLPGSIDAAKVGLSFPLRGEHVALAAPPGEELGCKGWSDPTLYSVKQRQKEAAEERRAKAEAKRLEREAELKRRRNAGESVPVWGISGTRYDSGLIGMSGQDWTTCELDDEGQGGPLAIGGEVFAEAKAMAHGSCGNDNISARVYRSNSEERVLVVMDLDRATVRVAASPKVLREAGGCGGIGGIGLRGRGGGGVAKPKTQRIPAAVGKTKVYFPSGALAGYHMRGTTRLDDAKAVDKRLCIDHDNVSTRVCFDRKDLTEIEVLR